MKHPSEYPLYQNCLKPFSKNRRENGACPIMGVRGRSVIGHSSVNKFKHDYRD